ncbi:MAG: lipoprotein-releasing system ATP-binding protein LolD, partial [Tenericutes bacterium HGW-Tenericutes-6]
QVYELLRTINKTFKTTFIIITHDRHIAEKADRIIEIKDGRIHLDIKNN